MSANDFDKYINNEVKVLEEHKWINDCGSKARKKAICNAELSYKPKTEPLGIDLGLKDLAIVSDGMRKKNINKTPSVKKLEKKLKREQVRLSRKYECLKK